MEVTSVKQRSYIKIVVLRGKNAMEYHSELVEAFRNNALPYRTVARKKHLLSQRRGRMKNVSTKKKTHQKEETGEQRVTQDDDSNQAHLRASREVDLEKGSGGHPVPA
ncbi:hypothetical protein TNCV_3830581 [Trichonephila clavipes]|nr:hypothetical protein TNCV_3830581 [Trichonephila clavipes]